MTLLDFHLYNQSLPDAGCGTVGSAGKGARGGGVTMERMMTETVRNAFVGMALTIAVVGGGLAVAFW